jgi:hypothetical protein
MPTKRVPLNRGRKPRITPEAARLFLRAEELQPTYDWCVSGRKCKSKNPGRHCSECTEFFRLRRLLAQELGLNSVCDTSPLEVDSPEPPVYIRNNPAQEPGYRRAWALRQALIEAAGEPEAE